VEPPALIVILLLNEALPVLGELTLAREKESPVAGIHLGANGDTTSGGTSPSDESDILAKSRMVGVLVHLTDVADLDALEEGEGIDVTSAEHDDIGLDGGAVSEVDAVLVEALDTRLNLALAIDQVCDEVLVLGQELARLTTTRGEGQLGNLPVLGAVVEVLLNNVLNGDKEVPEAVVGVVVEARGVHVVGISLLLRESRNDDGWPAEGGNTAGAHIGNLLNDIGSRLTTTNADNVLTSILVGILVARSVLNDTFEGLGARNGGEVLNLMGTSANGNGVKDFTLGHAILLDLKNPARSAIFALHQSNLGVILDILGNIVGLGIAAQIGSILLTHPVMAVLVLRREVREGHEVVGDGKHSAVIDTTLALLVEEDTSKAFIPFVTDELMTFVLQLLHHSQTRGTSANDTNTHLATGLGINGTEGGSLACVIEHAEDIETSDSTSDVLGSSLLIDLLAVL